MTDEKLAKILAIVEALAKEEVWADGLDTEGDVIVDDYAGGNVDDAYQGGVNSGEVLLARRLLEILN